MQVGRRVNEKPPVKTFGITADGNARLRLRRNLSGTRRCAVRTGTVPLWQAAAGCAA